MENRKSIQQRVLGKLVSEIIKELRPLSHTKHKNQSKWFKDVDTRPGSTNLLSETKAELTV